MSNAALDIVGIVIGCALYMAIIIVALTWRELKLRKVAAKQGDKGFVAMQLYRKHLKTEREQQSNQPDRLLGVMRDFFAELRERDKNNDKTG